jgi:hypothetical protein
MARNRTIKLCSHWVARLAGVALLLSASMAQAGLITLDVTGVTSNGQLGSAGNTVLTVDLNQALGTTAGSEVTITGIGWDVVISTLGFSWIDEALVEFQDTSGNGLLVLRPGLGDDRSGTETFSSGGIFDLVASGIEVVLNKGILVLEFAEEFSDNDGTDAVWGAAASTANAVNAFSALNDVPPQTSTLTLEVSVDGIGVPAPGTLVLMLGGLGLLLTRRQLLLG